MALIPFLAEDHFFDSIFDEMNRDMVRMHQDMRTAMNRITPRDCLSAGGDSLMKQLEQIRDPIVTKDDGSKELCLQFDLGGFKPDEISVKTKDGELQVEAKHEEKTEGHRVFHHFSRCYKLPEEVNDDKLTSSLSKDGVLVVRGPVSTPAIEQGKEVPVAKE